MLKIFLTAFAAVFLTACVPTLPSAGLPTPSTVAEQSILDEQLGIGVELGYKLWRVAVETGVKAGEIKGEKASRVAEIDLQLYNGLLAVRSAYATGNAATYSSAVVNFNRTLALGHAALGAR